MSAIISGSISLEKLQEAARTIEQHSNGNTYVPITIFVNDDVDQYGNNASIQLSQSKEEREAKETRTYFGNAKVVYVSSDGVSKAVRPDEGDDLPF
ncbi:MAG: hypothetical protein HRT70_05360 [Flavobacteriaceae bacterium]|nr:hypothetical protein [Flavobacteriaceae bacterium]